MLKYTTTKDLIIRESEGSEGNFLIRIGIPKNIALEIFSYCNSIPKKTLSTINFQEIKNKLNIPKYAGLELFLDIKDGRVELKGEDIIIKN